MRSLKREISCDKLGIRKPCIRDNARFLRKPMHCTTANSSIPIIKQVMFLQHKLALHMGPVGGGAQKQVMNRTNNRLESLNQWYEKIFPYYFLVGTDEMHDHSTNRKRSEGCQSQAENSNYSRSGHQAICRMAHTVCLWTYTKQ